MLAEKRRNDTFLQCPVTRKKRAMGDREMLRLAKQRIWVGGGNGAPCANLVEHLVVSHELSVQWVKPKVGIKQVVDLYSNSGLTASEVGKRLGISRTTVLERLKAAKSQSIST